MATVLPAIHSPGGKSASVQQHHVASPSGPKSAANSQLHIVKVTKRYQGKKERELEQKRMMLRAQQPLLSHTETAQYVNTYKHNLCLDMLQQGYHQSFAELFALIKQQNEARLKAGPESVLWNQVLLENEHEKLETLKTYLTQAERASRAEKYPEVYMCQYELARYFQNTNDKWLSDHFYDSCLATAENVQNDGGKLAAQGHCNVGLAKEESGDYFGAAENYEQFHKLSEGQDWMTEDGQSSLPVESCHHLTRIYTTIARQFEKNGDLTQYLEFLQKAHKRAKESGDRQSEGEASYRLGQAYEKNKDSQTALLYLSSYFDTCQALGDSQGMGKACDAMAKSYDSQGKVEESIKYLEKFVEVAEKSKDDKALSVACSDLGAMFNSLGRYEQAVEYFNKSYTISRAMNDTETISSSRVLFGVAAAHKMLEHVATHVDLATRPCLERIIEWKDNRGDHFEKPIPTQVTEATDSSSQSRASTTAQSEKPTQDNDQEAQDSTIQEEVSEGLTGPQTTRETTEDTTDTTQTESA